MKNLKFLLPMLAFIFAIGVAFSPNGMENDPLNDYIHKNGVWEVIPEQDNCGEGQITCQVMKDGQGPFTVYNSKNFNTGKVGDGTIRVLP